MPDADLVADHKHNNAADSTTPGNPDDDDNTPMPPLQFTVKKPSQSLAVGAQTLYSDRISRGHAQNHSLTDRLFFCDQDSIRAMRATVDTVVSQRAEISSQQLQLEALVKERDAALSERDEANKREKSVGVT